VVTTERYIGTRQKLKNTPGDRLHFTTCDDAPDPASDLPDRFNSL
jgi:hypothetical protein